MEWKKILINFIVIPFFIATLSGIVVYYLTKPSDAPKEILTYELDSPISFESDKIKLSLMWVTIRNQGNSISKDINAAIKFSTGTRIKSHKINFSSIQLTHHKESIAREKDGDLLKITLPELLPQASLTIAIMLDSAITSPPEVLIKSDVSIGLSQSAMPDKKKGTLEVLGIFSSLIVFPIAFIASLLVSLRKLFGKGAVFGSANNSAFVLMHKGDTEDAYTILQNTVHNKNADTFILANYALATALKGNTQQAKSILAAASWWGDRNDIKALCCFNLAIIKLIENNEADAIAEIKKALTLKNETIRSYIQMSTIIQEKKKAFIGFAEAIK